MLLIYKALYLKSRYGCIYYYQISAFKWYQHGPDATYIT